MAPRAGDVVMRTLRLHVPGKSDPHDTARAIGDFHVARLEWSYVTEKDFIAGLQSSGRLFGGAAAAPSYLPRGEDEDWFEKVVIRDSAGEPIIAPWKRNWNRTLWGCINNPEYERGYVEYLKGYVDAGAEVMQRDEPGANFNATGWGGCFCPHCVEGFRAYVAEKTTAEDRRELGVADLAAFDYREHVARQGAPAGDAFRQWEGGPLKQLFLDFQTEATIAFHRRTRGAIDRYAGRRLPFSCNNGGRRFTPIELEFDWFFGELSYDHALPENLLGIVREAAVHRRVQVLTMPKKGDQNDLPGWQRRTRQTIAMTYACGGLCMAPWDVYMPKDAPRYFGTPGQYADLYGFIRACRDLLDGYEEAAAAGGGLRETRFGDPPPLALEGDDVWAVARARPGEKRAPIVVHLVSWADQPQAVELKLRTACFFGPAPLEAELLLPPPYDRAAHEKAEQSGDFSPLRRTIKLPCAAEGDRTMVRIPPLEPWGILVLTAAD